jgi:superfamily II DNA or RNA helicase
LRDGVVRPVLFLAYAGQMRWRTRAGDEVSAQLGEPLTRDLVAQAWRTALDPGGDWVPAVLAAADRRLTEVRRQMPDAGGLVIASDQASARAYAAHLRQVTGARPVVVLSDDDGASARIEAFSRGDDRWMVAVRMVSEGVDVPRLAVGVYATSAATPLFFAQAVGRFVRARRRGETASVFLPSVAPLLALAAELEAERDHALDRPASGDGATVDGAAEAGLLAAANRSESASGDLALPGFEALDAQASFDRVVFDGGEFGAQAAVGSSEEEDFLGIPGLLDADQVAALLRARQADHLAARRAGGRAGSGTVEPADRPAGSRRPVDDHRRLAALRKELASLVGAWARRSGQPHAVVHTELRRRAGGPEVALAGVGELEARVALVRQWCAERR